MYSHIIACTGWTWEYIDDYMTIPRLTAMSKYWKDYPPVHQLLAGFLGVEKQPHPDAAASTDPSAIEQQSQDLMGLVGSGILSEKPEWLKTAETM